MLPLLAAAGHDTIGLTGSRGGAERLADEHNEGLADVAVVDALDGPAVTDVVAAVRPDIMVSQLTALAPRPGQGITDALERTARLRVEGTLNLVAAAITSGVGRLIAQSLAFAYAPTGQPVVGRRCLVRASGVVIP